MAKTPAQICSFCLRPRTEVDLLISGHKAEICSDCVEQSVHLQPNQCMDAV